MVKIRPSNMLVVAGLGLLPLFTVAGERKAAEVECIPVERQELTYECMISLEGKKSGEPIAGAEFTVGADMPSMPGTHNVRPVPAEAHGMPGMYRARIQLEMSGEWALKLDFTRPDRDRVVKKLDFGGMEGHGEHGSGMSHGATNGNMDDGGHGSHAQQETD